MLEHNAQTALFEDLDGFEDEWGFDEATLYDDVPEYTAEERQVLRFNYLVERLMHDAPLEVHFGDWDPHGPDYIGDLTRAQVAEALLVAEVLALPITVEDYIPF